MKTILILATLLVSFSAQSYPKIPEIWNNPGHLCSTEDKDFDHYRYSENIPYCRRNVSTRLKDEICRKYGVENRNGYTIDHIIPLSIGGSNSEENLWCQNRQINSSKMEFWLYQQVRDGKMSHAEAVHFVMEYKFNPKDKNLKPE